MKCPTEPEAEPGDAATPHIGIAIVCLMTAMLTACLAPHAVVEPGGQMNVLGPGPGFTTDALPADWVVAGNPKPQQLSIATILAVPSLKVTSGDKSFVAARRASASLLATPYLSWSWNMERHDGALHPIRLVVGFQGSDLPEKSWPSLSAIWSRTKLPPHNRAITITWADSALKRGTIDTPEAGDALRAATHYTARGGRENIGAWWLETVDLSQIYGDAFPKDDLARVRIAYIGVAATGGKVASSAYFSGIRLSR